MTWINFLHLYQPANTNNYIIREATEKSYYRIIRALEEHPKIKFTLNISGCLILRWEELGLNDIIKRVDKLIKKGQLELTGTAAFHPILPLIPEGEVIAQIKENETILKKHFGKNFKAKGFYLPEMAYSPTVAGIVKQQGYSWIILDEIAVTGKLNPELSGPVLRDRNSDLTIVIRSRKLSNSFAPTTITKLLKGKNQPTVVVTATDGELYGLRHIDHTAEFEKLLKNKDLCTLTVSELIKSQIITNNIGLEPHNWESTEKDLSNGQPFILWNEKNNTIQRKQWQLAQLAYETIEKYKKDKQYKWARWHFVRGLQSCTFWWSSARDFSKQFGPLSWNPDEIERGTNDLIRSIRSLDSESTREIKLQAEKLYNAIMKMAWQKHWAYYWKKT
jgi:predicted glycosyl hydrolase (DUF1957 family)